MQKVALVTGATGNLGGAVVAEFVKKGYTVVGTTEPGQMPKESRGADCLETNLADEESAGAMVKKVLDKYGRLDAAIMLAGGFAMGNIGNSDKVALGKMMDVNFYTAYFTARPAFDAMAGANGGHLVFVGARSALEAGAGKEMLPYALSKSLVFKLSEILNAAGKGKNVTSSVVVPSVIDTPPNRSAMPDADFSKWVKPEKIAQTIAFICSEEGGALREGVYKVYGDS